MTNDQPRDGGQVQDFRLSEHFMFAEATRTSRQDLQLANRVYALSAICADGSKVLENARQAAALMEIIRKGLGGKPLDIHSWIRSPELNGQTKGSSPTSQHPMGQAVDWSRQGPDTHESVWETFQETERILVQRGVRWGQLIFESVEGRYSGRQFWIHTSTGFYRRPERCGEVLTIIKTVDQPKPEVTLLHRHPVPPGSGTGSPGGY